MPAIGRPRFRGSDFRGLGSVLSAIQHASKPGPRQCPQLLRREGASPALGLLFLGAAGSFGCSPADSRSVRLRLVATGDGASAMKGVSSLSFFLARAPSTHESSPTAFQSPDAKRAPRAPFRCPRAPLPRANRIALDSSDSVALPVPPPRRPSRSHTAGTAARTSPECSSSHVRAAVRSVDTPRQR